LPTAIQTVLEPRKSPVQARSTASVEAILVASIQVLLQVGKERLTTTRVAARAGVSVGTLYQYFPNKSSLLQAVLKRHLNEVVEAVESACLAAHGQSVDHMAAALINAFLDAKTRNIRTSLALYAINGDLDGARISLQMGTRSIQAIAAMIATSPQPLTADPHSIAGMIYGSLTGISRRLLESPHPETHVIPLRPELIFFVSSYLNACSTRLS